MDEQLKKLDELARNILTMSRNTLLVNLRFLDMALSMFEYTPYQGTVGTNGKKLYYNPVHILKCFRDEREYSAREYLHMVFHCVFQHMFVGPAIDRRLWNLACDIAVESAISELSVKSTFVKKETDEAHAMSIITKKSGGLTAEKLYRYLLDSNLSESRLFELEMLFLYDDHSPWYEQDDNEGNGGGSEQGNQEHTDSSNGDNKTSEQEDSESKQSDSASTATNTSLSQEWKGISERIQQDIIMFSNGRYGDAGNIIQNLKEVNREKYDFAAFLKKFAVHTEVVKINDDEFDYVFYTYGLKLYKKIPLIEPLEYKDAKRIREFVIAIDTSGSVVGDLVQQFVQKTYNILKSTETFASKVNLHIIQCDTAIQEHVKLTTQEECENYIKNMTLKGFGGNNEILLFQYVDELIKNKEFCNLNGMIYFTDGYGIFPHKKPNYDVAFVFVNDRYEIPEVPPWVIKLILDKEDIDKI